MNLPSITAKADAVSLLREFRGLNKNEYVNDQEFSDMENMSNDYYPVFATRTRRGIMGTREKLQGVCGGRYLSFVADDTLFYNSGSVMELEKTGKDRQLVMMGAYLCVFPDGVVYNTDDGTTESMINETTAEGVTITLCKLDGTEYNENNTIVSATEPEDTAKYWLDTSQDTVVMKMYSQTESMWVSVATVYVKFSATGIGKGFSVYDGVRFSGVDTGSWIYNDYDFNTTNIIYACGDDYLIVVGLINLNHTNSKAITFKRELPDMDYVCEYGNRIWGCSSENHEIYSCKLGDPKNWNCFMGLDNDSYAATVGTEGVFTGAVSYGGYVFFFKADGYHKLYGTKPSNYEMVWKAGRGVQIGSERSIQIVDDCMIFKSDDGIYLYDGSMSCISSALGTDQYYKAVAGRYRHKYYVSMCDRDDSWHLYVYDVTKGMWVIEDDLHATYFATTSDGMFIFDVKNGVWAVNADDIKTFWYPCQKRYPCSGLYPGRSIEGTVEDDLEWNFTTGDIGMDSPYHKYLKRIVLRLWLDADAWMNIYVMYDSSDEWEKFMTLFTNRKKSYEVPVPIKRCDHVKLRFSGKGDVKLYSLAKVMEEGSGINGNL